MEAWLGCKALAFGNVGGTRGTSQLIKLLSVSIAST